LVSSTHTSSEAGDQDHVLAAEVGVQVLEQPDHPGALGGGAVAGHGHEVHLVRHGEPAAEVGHEHHGPFEHADEQHLVTRVVPGDAVGQLGHLLLDAPLVEQHRLDVVLVHACSSARWSQAQA
jgi:hypothetical protein